jgi:hypothetical protein
MLGDDPPPIQADDDAIRIGVNLDRTPNCAAATEYSLLSK